MKKTKIIGIIGGMGPQATIDLYQAIVDATPATRDQEHVHVIIDSYPQIPDRTEALLYGGESPLPYLVESLLRLEQAGADVIAIPCNTSHAYLPQLRKITKVPIIDMIKATTDVIKAQYPHISLVGLLATTGTIKTNLYQQGFYMNGHTILVPNESTQEKCVMEAIYGQDGIKAGNRGSKSLRLLQHAAQELIDGGAQIVIAGCTEIPLVLNSTHLPVEVVNPTAILAKAVVAYAQENKEIFTQSLSSYISSPQ